MVLASLNVIPSLSKNIFRITLSRPESLNALTLEMVQALDANLKMLLANRGNVKAILLEGDVGHPKPMFCAGGDMKAICLEGPSDEFNPEDLKHKFFREEYVLNHRIATNTVIPQISIWDGVVMGGGVGLSVHGKYRVATENTAFAMPEIAIGFFPDVGSSYWMPKLKGGLGTYLALTGARLKADDLLYSGIATHYIPSENLEEFRQSLFSASVGEAEDVASTILKVFHEDLNIFDCFLAQNQKEIDDAFDSKGSVEDICETLLTMDSDFSKKALDAIQNKASPTSLKVIFEMLKRGKELDDISASLAMEYRISQAFMKKGSDFYEGVRSVLVDKTHKARWKPSAIELVTAEMVDSYFEPLVGARDFLLEEQSAV